MSRPVFIANGSMAVGLGHDGLVHDFYYPYVGQENHTAGPNLFHRVGVWVDGNVSWLGDEGWQISLNYDLPALISRTEAINPDINVEITLLDFVDVQQNVYARKITIKNTAENQRDIRLFMNQAFRIADSKRDDTAQFLPEPKSILHYKGRRVFLVGGELADSASFDQYAIGLHDTEGHKGTYDDAADGELSNNNVEHGRVDSTIRFSLEIDANSTAEVNYWIAAGASRASALESFRLFANGGLNDRLDAAREHWQTWTDQAKAKLNLVDERFRQDVLKSLLIIKSHIDRRGAVIASADSEMLNYERDYYSYCWPRDAVYVLWPLIRLGYKEEAEAFFEFARDTLQPEGFLMHKYQPDRAIGSSWHPYLNRGREELPIQEDETAGVIFLLGEYLKASGDEDFVQGLYETMVQPMANFIDSYIDSATKLPHASYDLWEEKFLTTTYTTGQVYASLITAAELADRFEYPDDAIRWRAVADDIRSKARDTLFNRERGYFYKGFLLTDSGIEYDATIDSSSLYGAVMYGLFDSDEPQVKTAVATLRDTLLDKSPSRGLPRYEYDRYFSVRSGDLGNPWFVTTLWFAQYLILEGDTDTAREIMAWAQSNMMSSGALPEQIHPETSQHLSVAPLVWSSAEFINTALDITKDLGTK